MTLLAIAGTIAVTSCSESLEQDIEQDGETATSSKVTFRLSEDHYSKSSISPDETQIEEICIMVYREEDGALVTDRKCTGKSDIELELLPGRYRFYAVANAPSFSPSVNIDGIGNAAFGLSSINDLSSSLPMCWSGEPVELMAGKNETINIILERLVSKISLKIDTELIEGLSISSVQLCQCAKTIYPFMEGGSRALSVQDISDGDYAGVKDIEDLNTGKTIVLYAVENCQGNLLPNNTDPWEKTPDKMEEKDDLCTYIKVTGKWQEGADYEGSVTYKFYLGEDNTSNFDVRRNSEQNLYLYLEEEGLEKVSWKIDKSEMELVKWEADADFSNNFHEKDDFYVSERIRIDFEFDSKGLKYWSKRNNAFRLSGVNADGEEIIRFNEPADNGNGGYYSIGTCLNVGAYDIVIINEDTGEITYVMDSGEVKHPEIYASYNKTYEDDVVEDIDNVEMTINGNGCQVAFFLTDQAGYNLNQGHFYGCDFSVCDWEVEICNPNRKFSITDNAEITMTPGVSGNDGYALLCGVNIVNEGTDVDQNTRLTGSLGPDQIEIRLKEKTSQIEGIQKASLYCDDITVSIKPLAYGYIQQLESELMYIVNNPSNLPIYVRGLQFNSAVTSDNMDLWRITSSYIQGCLTSDPLVISKMPATICSLDSDGTRSVIQPDAVWYAVDDNGITSRMIFQQKALFHTFEADLLHECNTWKPEIAGSMDLSGNTTYGTNYFNSLGMFFFAGKKTYGWHDSAYGSSTNFLAYGNLIGKETIGLVNDIPEVTISVNDKNELIATSSEPVTLDIDVYGILHGHTRCVSVTDNSFTIWGQYFNENFILDSSGTYTLGENPIVIDGSCVSDAFLEMRQQPYYSVRNATSDKDFTNPPSGRKKIREYLKPYDLELNIVIYSEKLVAIKYDCQFEFEHILGDPVVWQISNSTYINQIPSTYSGFDTQLKVYGCPSGSLFKEETVTLAPKLSFDESHQIYFMKGRK